MTTKFKLKSDDSAEVPYSETERKAFAALPRVKFETTSQVLDRMYNDDRPFHDRNILNSLIRSLIRKMAANSEPFEIERSKRRGPHPIMVRIVKKS